MSTETKPKNEVTTAVKPQGKLLSRMADERGIDANEFYKALCATVMPTAAKQEDIVVFLMLCERYGFDPFAKHVYAFPGKGGGIQLVVSVDGWVSVANNHPQFDGMEYADNVLDDGKLDSVTCVIHRKDRSYPITCTEYMEECQKASEPWKQWPRRMLRHKATIQAIRMAFGISGVVDEDEYDRMQSCRTVDAIPDNRRVRPVELPEPNPERSKPNGTRGHVTSVVDLHSFDLPPGIAEAYERAIAANDPARVDEITADGITHADGNEQIASRFTAAGDSAKAQIEARGKKQKELV